MSARCGWPSTIAARSALSRALTGPLPSAERCVALAVDLDLDRRLGFDLAVGALLGRHPEALEPEEGRVAARLLAQQQLEGGRRGLVVIAAVLALLEPLDRARRRLVVELEAGLLGLGADRRLAGELGGEDLAVVADLGRVEVLEGAGVGGDAGGVHARLVGEGVAPDVGLVGVGRHVAELVEVVGGRGEARELLVADDVEAHLQLQGGQDRGEVGVAAALAVAVDACPAPGGRPLRPRRGCWRRRTRRRCGCGCRPRPRRRAPRPRPRSPRRRRRAGCRRWCRRG